MNNVRTDAKAIFLEALDCKDSDELIRFLDNACGSDAALRTRVEELLGAHRDAGAFLGGVEKQDATIDQPSQQPGTIIGPYKLLEQIGEGGMGLVYMAEQQRPVRRLVALKIIKPGMDSRQVIARFEAERQALAMMDHPNIAKVHDAGTTETGRPYFVMELVRGLPINEFSDQKSPTVRERLQLFVQVCQAVQHAHQKGIIHRDLKPTNVLVTMADTAAFPKLLDFGIAKALGQSLTDSTLHTGYSQLVGTPLYMSPEQAEMNLFGVDTRSDVYSLGVLLYELLTGSTPFDKEKLTKASFDEMRRIIREEEPETVSARIARTKSGTLSPREESSGHSTRSVPATELDWIVMKALEKDRNRRYESASALATDIQRYLSDEPVLACPPTTMYRFQKFARKHKPTLAAAAAIAFCLMLGTTVSAWQAVRATAAESQAAANEAQAKEAAASEAKERQRAEANEQKAKTERDEVKALNDKLAAKEQELQRTLYAAHMNLAQRAWDAGGIGRVSELLEQHRPKAGETDLRGFEWHYLYKLCHPELLTFRGGAMAFSPDGKRMAMGTNDSVRILDAQTNRELLSLQGRVWSVVFSPDGKRLATAVRDVEDEVKVWDAKTGHELHVFKGHDQGVWEVAFSPDGKHLASVGYGKTVIVRDSHTGDEVFSITGSKTDEKSHVEKIAYSPDGKQLAAIGNYVPVRVLDAQTGQMLFSIPNIHWYSMAFSPDGNRLVGGSPVKVWDTQTGQQVLTLKGNSGFSVAVSPDGKRLASCWPAAGNDYRVKFWDAQTGEELLTCKGRHKAQTTRMRFSPDGKRLASSAHDNLVFVWDAQTGDEILSLTGHTGAVWNVEFNHDGTRLASTSNDGTVRVWDVSPKPSTSTFSGTGRGPSNVAFSPDGKRLASASFDNNDKDNNDNTVNVWDVQTGEELLSLKGLTDVVFSVAFSPDGKRLATGSGTQKDKKDYRFIAGEVKVWDVQTGSELLEFKGHTGAVASMAFSPDGTRLASSTGLPGAYSTGADQGDPGEVKIWDAQTGKELMTLKGHRRFVNCVTFSPDSKRLATLSRDNRLKVWDVQTGQEVLSLKVSVGGRGGVAFSQDGKRLASSHDRGVEGSCEAKVWDAQTGAELLTLKGHTASVESVLFTPDGKRLLTSPSYRNTPGGGELKLWDAETGEELLTFDKFPGRSVAFSPDGHRLLSAETKGLKIYDATPVAEKP
jgi:eukaryotic-like serine/threonine-protein kinase